MISCDQEEIDAITRVLKSKKLFRYQGAGTKTECSLFENEFSQYLNVPHSIILSSGTNALVVALFANGISEGDEVLIPSYTFFATVSAILELGAVPVIININENLTIDIEEAQRKITPKTKALIVVHMDGEACDMDAIQDFVKAQHLILIEDVAQAVGGSFKGKKLGTFGDAGCFSFNVDKIISCGEGGAVVLNDAEKYQKALMFHDTCNQFGPTCKDLYTIEAFSGKSMRASEIQGAMIRVQLLKLTAILESLSARKIKLQNQLELLGFNLIPSFDPSGSCSTSIRIKVHDPSKVKDLVVKLNSLGLKSMPPLMRPGHNVWSWLSILKKYGNYGRGQYLQTIDHLSRVVVVFISLDENEKEWQEKISSIKEISL